MLNPNPECVGIWRWGIWQVLGDEDGAVVNGIIAFLIETSGISLVPCTTWKHNKKLFENQEVGPCQDTGSASASILNFPIVRTMRNKFMLLISYLVTTVFIKYPEQRQYIAKKMFMCVFQKDPQ